MEPMSANRPFHTLTQKAIEAFRSDVAKLVKNPENQKAVDRVRAFMDKFERSPVSEAQWRILNSTVKPLENSPNRDVTNLAWRLHQWVDLTNKGKMPMRGVSYDSPPPFPEPEPIRESMEGIVRHPRKSKKSEEAFLREEKIDAFRSLETNPDSFSLENSTITAKDAAEIARHGSIRELKLSNVNLQGGGVRNLSGLRNLVSLNISNNRLKNTDINLIKQFTQLQGIDLSHNKDIRGQIGVLSLLTHLSVVNLTDTGLTNEGLRMLGEMPNLQILTVGDPTFDLSALMHLTHLRRLDITAGQGSIAEALPSLRTLQHLVLPPGVSSKDLQAVCENLGMLQHLEVPGGLFGIEDRDIVQFALLRNLQTLILNNQLLGTTQGFEQLNHLPLTNLGLSGCSLTDANLVGLTHLPQLTRLDLSGNVLTNDALSTLVYMQNLQLLDLRETMIDEAGFAFLRNAMPNTQILSGPKEAV